MSNQVQITIDREIYDRLQMLMVPPISDANAAIEALLFHDGRTSRAASALESSEQHFTYEQELERAQRGVHDSGDCT